VHDRFSFSSFMSPPRPSARRKPAAGGNKASPDREGAERGALHPARTLDELGRGARRRLSQNFLTSLSVAAAIVRAADLQPADTVLEIGPGLGVLTQHLIGSAARVVAVELDADLAAELPARLGNPPNLHVVHGDALAVDLGALVAPPFIVVANLPYHVAGPILFRLLFEPPEPNRIVAMLQEEVAERVVAQPGRMTFLGAAVATVAQARIVRRVAPGSFFPVPKVRSAVVRLDRRAEPMVPSSSVSAFVAFLRAGFAQPRKQLRNSLAIGLGLAAGEVAADAAEAKVDPSRRPEQLTLAEWVALYYALRERPRMVESA
jgi:16S rRNA (adenine1518-N6/adenine1519-N6)-dimethyltransferase